MQRTLRGVAKTVGFGQTAFSARPLPGIPGPPRRSQRRREGGARLVGWGVLELWELGTAGRATPKPCNSQLRCRSVAK